MRSVVVVLPLYIMSFHITGRSYAQLMTYCIDMGNDANVPGSRQVG